MAWSTRQLAELAGTTVKSVRYYHSIGLLAEPERAANGYKRYTTQHLLRLLRIRRLADLGVPLSQIAEMDDTAEPSHEALRILDEELSATVDRLQRVRSELALIITQRLPFDLPVELAPVAGQLTHADRSLALVMTQVSDPETAEAYYEVLRESEPHPVADAFIDLPADADEHTRRAAAEQMVPHVRAAVAAYPELNWAASTPKVAARTAAALAAMMPVLYNPAQRDVLDRVAIAMAKDIAPDGRRAGQQGSRPADQQGSEHGGEQDRTA